MLNDRVYALFLAMAAAKYLPLRVLLAAKKPIVLLDRSMDHLAVSLARGDDHKGIRLAVQHLAALGHLRIAHFAGTDSVSNGFDRRAILTLR